MNRHVGVIAGRLSLRAPQRQSLEILDRVCELVPPRRGADRAAGLAAIRAEYPSVTDFEREFLSICFALATGVGKTRLIGAFIAYLHLAHGIQNFFVLAPNLTIYQKLITDFTPNTPKYVFRGISEFVTDEPEIVTGENFESRGALLDSLRRCKINIFNISKLNSEVRGGRQLRMRSFRETLGESYFDYLAGQPDLVLIMDESHRYRASAGWRALNELKPVVGLELTATPFVETPKGPVPFKNVILDYPLGRAMADGFVKEPVVVTRRDFNPAGMSAEAIQRLKLEDGIRLHESVKVELETYARQSGLARVKPFLLVIARDITHAAELKANIEGELFSGRYAGRVIQVDSSVKEDATVQALLNVERAEEPTEIVIHVNMLKEGWDVTNLYTIVPLRAANARTLIEQSIGRGLRLPYGARTGVAAVDRLNIVAHDRFQEIVDSASRPDSPIRMRSLVLDDVILSGRTTTIVSRPRLADQLGLATDVIPSSLGGDGFGERGQAVFNAEEGRVARIAWAEFRRLEAQPDRAPTSASLLRPDIQAVVVVEVERQYRPAQVELGGIREHPDVASVVARTAELVVQGTINIPRILVTPRGEVRSGYRPFTLDLANIRPQPGGTTLWLQELRTGRAETLLPGSESRVHEKQLEDYLVRRLIDKPDIAYDQHADLLYDLAGQFVAHLRTYLPEEEVAEVLSANDELLANLIHGQMQGHYEEAVDEGYEVVVKRGWTMLRDSAFTAAADEEPLDFRAPPPDLNNIARYVFGGFRRCLYPALKFQSNAERKLAIVLDRDSEKWFKPAKGQFQIYYRRGADHPEYVPDFVVEVADRIFMLESKASNQLADPEVMTKRDVAQTWCAHASAYAVRHGGKPWSYVLVPDDSIAENMTLERLAFL
ncbi:type III restriction endonuclease subunit R [Methylobacterium phyllosphaerae]|uniref:Type III restriction endonuclease subunit R n=1 Tax=Methylobacterium phyllosphaerae TaxID=418223 RepID=A0AAE8HQ05_9HYPH|nr:DEAD/DEAH box helicase family protein [Methylobacterium phyllosphaerae]APT33485.1 type III restriction endonuclease subunit R [Methylobacterium phyllosphaerae]SFG61599.1 type III restriction enzyme [Methylobacterium phyllosphaerae]